MRATDTAAIDADTSWCGTWWECTQPACPITVLRPSTGFWAWHTEHAPTDNLLAAWQAGQASTAGPGNDQSDANREAAGRRAELDPATAPAADLHATANTTTVPTSLARATVRRRLTLHGGYPPVNIAEQADPATATYRFLGRRATGTIVIIPDFGDETEPIPTRVHVHLGAGPRYSHDRDRTDQPVINGVTLHGRLWLHPAALLARDKPRLTFDKTGGSRTTDDYATAILTAILTHWLNRPQRGDELHTIARQRAASRLAHLHHGAIRQARERLTKARAELAELDQAAAQLADLATQHQHHHPDDGTQRHNRRSWFAAYAHVVRGNQPTNDRDPVDAAAFADWHIHGHGPDQLPDALTEFIESPVAT
jgi:hypothetical protein